MPPLSNITLMQPVSVVPNSPNASPPSNRRRFRSLSVGSSAEFCASLIHEPMKPTTEAATEAEEEEQQQEQQEEESTTKQQQQQQHHVSFNPRVRVIETHYVDVPTTTTTQDSSSSSCSSTNKSIFDPSQTWYTSQEIDEFQKHAFFVIKKFQRSWHLGPNDCLRGLEAQTTKCTATKVRIHVYKDLLLAKKDATKRLVQKSPQKVRHMMCVILQASEQDALELAQVDATQAQLYQLASHEPTSKQDDDDECKCSFLSELLPNWLVPMKNHNKTPAIVDLAI